MNKQWADTQDDNLMASVRIFGNHYGHSVHHINNLVKQAKLDFPEANLLDSDIEVVLLSGQQYRHMTAIEFRVDKLLIPKEYFGWTRFDDLGWPKHY